MAWPKATSELTNGSDAMHRDDTLPHSHWSWPENTWLQQKRRELREARKEEKTQPVKPPSEHS
jgi:hypothetical protein